MRLPAGLALIVAVLGLSGCKSAPTAVERLSPCRMNEGPTDAYCGKLEVFENRAAKSGRKISLKIVVLPALRRDSKPDPLFLFAGGPGQGAAKMAGTFSQMFRRFQNDRDLVMIDQRGTGDSHSLACKLDDGKDDGLTNLDDYPLEKFKQCLDKYDADPRFYTTSIAMDDIDDVRRHLGYGKINLWGGSYGTRAALVYLRQHPETVRSAIIDGVAPVDMRLPLYVPRDSQRALDRLLADCEADKACRGRYPALRSKIEAVLEKAAGKPKVRLTHPRTGERTDVTLSRNAVASVIFLALYSPTLSSLIPRLVEDAAAGDFQPLLALAFAGEGGADNMSQGMFLSVICAEDVAAFKPSDAAGIAKGTFFGTAMLDTRTKPCAFWPRGEVGDDYRQPVASDLPVLILSGDLDPITPPEWGEHVARHLKNSRHIVVPGTGHGATAAGCVPRLMSQFLASTDPKSLDDSCVKSQHRPPFFVNHSGPAGESAK